MGANDAETKCINSPLQEILYLKAVERNQIVSYSQAFVQCSGRRRIRQKSDGRIDVS